MLVAVFRFLKCFPIPRAQQHSQAKAKGRARPTRCVALQPAHPRGTRRRERTCVVGARQAGAKTIKGLRSCRTNRPGPSNAVPQISTIHERAASSNAAAATAAITKPIRHRQSARPGFFPGSCGRILSVPEFEIQDLSPLAVASRQGSVVIKA